MEDNEAENEDSIYTKFYIPRKKNLKKSIDRSPNRNNRTILKAREIFKIVAERLLKKKTSIIRIKSREIQSPYISFPLQTPFPPICLTLRSTFPPLFAANFPLLRANSLLNAFTPVFFTTHIPWYISRPWANPLANAKTTLYPPSLSPTCRKLQVHHRCGVLHPRWFSLSSRLSRAGYFLPEGREGGKFSSL